MFFPLFIYLFIYFELEVVIGVYHGVHMHWCFPKTCQSLSNPPNISAADCEESSAHSILFEDDSYWFGNWDFWLGFGVNVDGLRPGLRYSSIIHDTKQSQRGRVLQNVMTKIVSLFKGGLILQSSPDVTQLPFQFHQLIPVQSYSWNQTFTYNIEKGV